MSRLKWQKITHTDDLEENDNNNIHVFSISFAFGLIIKMRIFKNKIENLQK